MSDNPAKTNILSDLPTDVDALDFTPYIETLADIVRSPDTSTPMTIGIFGTWGSGKTSLMRMVQHRLLVKDGFRTAWFDAWKYDKETILWRALLLQVLDATRKAIPKNDETALDELADIQATLYRPLDREEVGNLQIDWGKAGSGLAQGALQIGLSFLPVFGSLTKMIEELQKEGSTTATEKLVTAIQRQRTQVHIEQVQFLEQFHERFEKLVSTHIQKKGHRLVVFIDDLDRCMPEKAIEVLEAIKLFLDVKGCIFVLGLDQGVIARGIELKYRELRQMDEGETARPCLIDGNRYLEKIIQLPFQIPPIEQEDMSVFVNGLVDDWPDAACPQVFSQGLGDNPRQIKRTINVFLLLWNLSQKRKKKLGDRIKPVRLAKVVAIQNIYPALYETLKTTPRLLRELEDYYRADAQPERGQKLAEDDAAEIQRTEAPPALAPYVNRAAVRRILTMHPPETLDANFSGLTPAELRLYFTLTRRAEAPQVTPTEVPHAAFEPQMVRIPAGAFLMGSTEEQIQAAIADGLKEEYVARERPQHEVHLPEYLIGKYPVTNAEYQTFVRENGHRAPGHWDDGELPSDKSDHPVVNISWDDAIAYCQWLSEKTGKEYRLPTEVEWEKAARGVDGLIYAWGNDWDAAKCNSEESGPGDTTPVGQYSPQGDSPYDCADMLGNVWEWTNSALKDYPYSPEDGREGEKADNRILRGGSYYNGQSYMRCAYRYRLKPRHRYSRAGFRCCCATPSLSGSGS